MGEVRVVVAVAGGGGGGGGVVVKVVGVGVGGRGWQRRQRRRRWGGERRAGVVSLVVVGVEEMVTVVVVAVVVVVETVGQSVHPAGGTPASPRGRRSVQDGGGCIRRCRRRQGGRGGGSGGGGAGPEVLCAEMLVLVLVGGRVRGHGGQGRRRGDGAYVKRIIRGEPRVPLTSSHSTTTTSTTTVGPRHTSSLLKVGVVRVVVVLEMSHGHRVAAIAGRGVATTPSPAMEEVAGVGGAVAEGMGVRGPAHLPPARHAVHLRGVRVRVGVVGGERVGGATEVRTHAGVHASQHGVESRVAQVRNRN